MEALVGKLVGKLEKRMWVQVYEYTPETEEKLAKKGRMIAVVSYETHEDKEQVEMVQIGREILARLHEWYFGTDNGSVMESLKIAVLKVEEEFEGVEIVSTVMFHDLWYVVSSENGGVWVGYLGKQGWLINPNVAAPDKQLAFSGRGVVGEVVVLGNKRFWSGVTEGMLRAAVETAVEEMDAGLETLAAVQRGNETAGGEAGVMIKLTAVTTEEVQSEEEETEAETEITEITEKKRNPLAWVLRSVGTKISSGLGGKIYIRHGDKQEQRRKMMYLGVGFLAVLLLMAAVGQVIVKQKNVTSGALDLQIEKLVDSFSEASADVTLNPSRSRQLLAEIKPELDKLISDKNKDARVMKMASEYALVLQEASGIVTTNVNELLDLSLVRPEMDGNKLALGDGKLEVLDVSGNRVVEVVIKTGAGTVTAGGDNYKGARLITTYPGKTVVVTDNGIRIVETNKNAVENDKDATNYDDIKMYGGNIYLLDHINGQIWRYAATTTGGFGKKSSWLTNKNGEDELKEGSGMAIDGSIWIIKPSGLLKFTRGDKERVDITGVDKLWGAGAVLYTDENSQKLYIMDPANNRVLILTKGGQYERQLSSDNFGKMKDMTVDENGGKLYFVGGGKVWVVNL